MAMQIIPYFLKLKLELELDWIKLDGNADNPIFPKIWCISFIEEHITDVPKDFREWIVNIISTWRFENVIP